MNNPSPEFDLSLLSLRYAAGELDADESVAFEQRLAGDLDAQLALAEAVQISHALLSISPAGSVVAVPRHDQPAAGTRRASGWLAVVGSGLVAAVLLVVLQQGSDPESPGGAISENAAVGATLSGWAAVELEDAAVLSADDAVLLILDDERPVEDDIPDWLFAAVEMSDVPANAGPADTGSAVPPDSIDEET